MFKQNICNPIESLTNKTTEKNNNTYKYDQRIGLKKDLSVIESLLLYAL